MNNTEAPIRNIVVAVDVQNDFINGNLAVKDGEQVVTPLGGVIESVRSTGGEVVFTRDWHPAVTPHFADYGGTWPTHCVADTEGAAFHPALDVRDEDSVISKGTGHTDGYSGWEGRGSDGATLETVIAPLSPLEKVRVFIGGLATDYCVKATGLDIAERFREDDRVSLYVLRDAVRAVNLNETDGEAAMQAMIDAAIVAISSEEARAMVAGTAR